MIKTSRISFRSEDLHIAEFCLHYLNFGCFDASLTNSEIQEFLRQGYYAFEDYAVAHWLDHVESSTSQPLSLETIALEPLSRELEAFFIKHGSHSLENLTVSTENKFRSIREWELTKRLDGISHLARQRQSNEDYLDLETQLQRRRLIYEDVVASTDSHNESSLVHLLLNGSEPFKCPKIWCEFFSAGFPHKESRDKHVNRHERPFRCSFEECLYARLGYGTEAELKRHEKKSHPIGHSSEWVFPSTKPKKDLDIFSASKKGDLATVQRLVGEGEDISEKMSMGGFVNPLYLAVKHNHPDVAHYAIGQGCNDIRYRSLFHAISNRTATLEMVQILLEMGATPNDKMGRARVGLDGAAKCGREDVIPLLLTYNIDINHKYGRETALQISRRNGHHACAQVLLDNGARDASPEPASPTAPPTPRPASKSYRKNKKDARERKVILLFGLNIHMSYSDIYYKYSDIYY